MSEFDPSAPLVPGRTEFSKRVWEMWEQRDNTTNKYALAYAHGRQEGLSHEEAVQAAQLEAYGKIRSENPLPENAGNRRLAELQLSMPVSPHDLAMRANLANAPSTPIQLTPEDVQQLRLPLTSRGDKGKFASPTKVSNPEDVARTVGEGGRSVMDPMSLREAEEFLARMQTPSPGQLDLLAELASRVEPSAIEAVLERNPEVVAQSQSPEAIKEAIAPVSPNRRRMAGGLAVTAGLGLSGLLALAALTDPYRVEESGG